MMASACFDAGPCTGRFSGLNLGPARQCEGRFGFGSPFGPQASIVTVYRNESLPVDPSVDPFKFREDRVGLPFMNANIVIWDAESFEFLQHVLAERPARLLDPLAARFDLARLMVVPDQSPMAPVGQKLLLLKYEGPTFDFVVRVRAIRTGPSTFGEMSFD